ncbi:MAG: MarR family transcriptional regulator [Verrucomicrobia bacterium]|nr:MarR family transcriptional regulator [Verrucomicrobiota bacterium]
MNTSHLRSCLSVARFYQLNLTQTEALCVVSEHRNLTVGSLASHLGVTTAAITHVADTLVRLGFVERRNGISDRRHIWLDITQLGQEVLNNILRRTAIQTEQVANALPQRKAAAAV